MTTILLGGIKATDEERIYPKDADFILPSGERVVVMKSDIPSIDMNDLFARHRARYLLPGLFCRPKKHVLDFPCGPGYAAEVLEPLGIIYHGLDCDPVTVEYARCSYSSPNTTFGVGDLCAPDLERESYDIIACIEGLEHIKMEYQDHLIETFKKALKSGGVLVVSSPENCSGVSGQSPDNKWHVGELTKKDFVDLLSRHFPSTKVELVTHSAVLSTGKLTNCFYGVCHKD